MLENPKGFLLSVFSALWDFFPKIKKNFFLNFFMLCDRMDVEKPQRVPPFSFSALWDVSAPLGPIFLVCNFFKKKFSKNFRFSTSVKEYLTLGSLFAIFEPWIWLRLGPVPACSFLYLSMTFRVFLLDAMIWLFADDLNLLFSSLNFHNDLTRLYNWNLSNGMIANLGKTNCLNFRGLTSVTMNDCLLKEVEYTKDLGIIVSHSLKWTDSVQMRVTKAQRSFYSLKQKIPWQTPSENKFNLYFSQVLSVLLFGIPSWSPDITRLK